MGKTETLKTSILGKMKTLALLLISMLIFSCKKEKEDQPQPNKCYTCIEKNVRTWVVDNAPHIVWNDTFPTCNKDTVIDTTRTEYQDWSEGGRSYYIYRFTSCK